jgi:Jagunal, ER re-organisation during oogenesis
MKIFVIISRIFRWEYFWCVSVVLSFIGLSAIRSNRVINMQKYMIGVVLFGLMPILYCAIYYMSDVIAYMNLEEDEELEDAENITVWQVRIKSFIVT